MSYIPYKYKEKKEGKWFHPPPPISNTNHRLNYDYHPRYHCYHPSLIRIIDSIMITILDTTATPFTAHILLTLPRYHPSAIEIIDPYHNLSKRIGVFSLPFYPRYPYLLTLPLCYPIGAEIVLRLHLILNVFNRWKLLEDWRRPEGTEADAPSASGASGASAAAVDVRSIRIAGSEGQNVTATGSAGHSTNSTAASAAMVQTSSAGSRTRSRTGSRTGINSFFFLVFLVDGGNHPPTGRLWHYIHQHHAGSSGIPERRCRTELILIDSQFRNSTIDFFLRFILFWYLLDRGGNAD